MPSPRLQARRRHNSIGRRHWMVFARGPSFGDPWNKLDNTYDIAEVESILADMRQSWESAKESLLRHWVTSHPGTRPWAWWEFDAPEKHRRIVSGPGYSSLRPDSPCCAAMKRKAIRFGVCGLIGPADDGENICESEYAYLRRLNLLTAEEKRIPASEFPNTNENEDWHRADELWLPNNL